MKKNDWLLIGAAGGFSVLFYQRAPGLNFFLFTLLITSLTAVFNRENLRQRAWWYYAAVVNLCGAMVLIVNSDLAVIATLFSLLAFSGKSFNTRSSLLIAGLFAFYSLISSPVYLIMDVLKRKAQQPVDTGSQAKWRFYGGALVALLISILFLALYQQANPLFKNFTENLDLSWISFGWCLFTVWGFLMIYGLLFYRDAEILRSWDLGAAKRIAQNSSENADEEPFNHRAIALTLFALLNVMLLVINCLDIDNLFLSKQLPEGITLSDFVHNAVTGLVFSIVFAMALILWFFRGDLNFHRSSRWAKGLAYAWILQSALMVISALIRNAWYIEAYQLTELRIGVYVFLTLSLIGLVFTFLKLQHNYTAWFLLRCNTETWLLLLALSTTVNWDKMITKYNLTHAKNYSSLDRAYLCYLSQAGLPELTQAMYERRADTANDHYDFTRLGAALYSFLSKRDKPWQSFNFRDPRVGDDLDRLFENGKIDYLDLCDRGQIRLAYLPSFRQIKTLKINELPSDAWRFMYFQQLEKVEITHFGDDESKWLTLCPTLKQVNIGYHNGRGLDLEPLLKLQQLDSLKLPEIDNEDLEVLRAHSSLKHVDISRAYGNQIDQLRKKGYRFTIN